MKIIFKSDGLLQKVWEIFDFFQKSKNGLFSGPIYHQIHLDGVKKSLSLMISMEKQKNVHLRFLIFENSSHTF
jgi:hypothetical protein